jgi:hypothetical protein
MLSQRFHGVLLGNRIFALACPSVLILITLKQNILSKDDAKKGSEWL